ncbi:MAG: hypothetical protein CMM07_07080 [Rhodopirellula sp.]|nr:hypothetical protein [Rhodopirellula sp.]
MAMPKTPTQTWREPIKSSVVERRTHMIRRVMIVSVITLLTVLLFSFLLPPFFNPSTHVVLMGTGINENYQTPFIPFVKEDQNAFREIDGILVHDQADEWSSRRNAERLVDRVKKQGVKSGDQLIVYLTAHGIVDAGGNAFLLCDDFEVDKQARTRVLVNDLLDELSECDVASKTLILNAGQIDYDPRLGVFVNDFPERLRAAVEQCGDSSLWVYCSHQSLQYSQVSHAVQRSIFGLFITEGLRGAADIDQNRQVDLQELAVFTSANVASWVRQMSAGVAHQAPLLLRANEGSLTSSPKLVTLDPAGPPYHFDVTSLLPPEELITGAAVVASSTNRFTGVLRRRDAQSNQNFPSVASGSAGQASGDSMPPASDAEIATAKTNESDNKPDPENVADAETSDAAKQGETKSAKSSGGKNAGKASGVKLERDKAMRLLAAAWQERDQTANSWSEMIPADSPVENWPHIWREYQNELARIGQRLRGGDGIDPATISALLEGGKTKARGPGKSSSSASSTWHPLEYRNTKAIGDLIPTLGLALVVFSDDTDEIGIDVAGLNVALEKENEQDFLAWVKANASSTSHQYRELVFFEKLIANPALPWELVQTAAKTCLHGERVAALDLLAPGWVREKLGKADSWRFGAEALLVTQIGPDWQDRVARGLEKAGEVYRAAELDLHEVRNAQHLRDVLIVQAPAWIHLHRRVGTSNLSDGSAGKPQLLAMLKQLNELISILSQPGVGQQKKLVDVVSKLSQTKFTVESECSYEVVYEMLSQRVPEKGVAWRSEQYLLSPFITSSTRQFLLASIGSVARELTAGFRVVRLDKSSLSEMPDAAPEYLEVQFVGMKLKADLDFELAKLFYWGEKLKDTKNNQETFLLTEKVHRELIAKYRDLESAQASGTPAQVGKCQAELLRTCRDFGHAIASFYELALESLRTNRSRNASGAGVVTRSLRLLDPRDASSFLDLDVLQVAFAPDLRSTLVWQKLREKVAMLYLGDSLSEPVSFASVPLPGLPVGVDLSSSHKSATHDSADPAVELVVDSAGRLDLQDVHTGSVSVGLNNRSGRSISVVLALGYNRDLVTVYPENTEQTKLDFKPAVSSLDKTGIASTTPGRVTQVVKLRPGEMTSVNLRIHRTHKATQSSVITVDVYEEEGRHADSGRGTRLLDRKNIAVVLPVAELFVRQSFVDGAFLDVKVKDEQKIVLHPYPNRLNSFRFGLRNHSEIDKNVSVAIYHPSTLLGATSSSKYAQMLAGMVPLAEYKFAASANGSACFPVASESKKKEGPGKDKSVSPVNKGEAPGKPAAALPLTDLVHGMLVAITDVDSGQVTYRRVRCDVQRPRRYVKPEVRYDAFANQISVSIAARDQAQIPVGKSVGITAYLGSSLSSRVSGKLKGTLSAPGFQDALYIKLPSPPPERVRLCLDVDDYPRAFIYEVPCDRSALNVAELTDLMEVQVATTDGQRVFAATSSIPAEVKVNAPLGTFEDDQDSLQLVLKSSLEGTAGDVSSLTWDTDRFVSLGFQKSLPDGTLELLSKVSDFKIDMPSSGLENVSLDLIGRICVRNKRTKESLQTLRIDSTPPLIGVAQSVGAGGFAAAQSKIDVRAFVWDSDSRVKQVEAAFEAGESLAFPTDGVITQADAISPKEWKMLVPVGNELGERTLLIRAIDEVGNASRPFPLKLSVLSPAETKQMLQKQTVELTGTVRFRDELVPNTTLGLSAVSADPAAKKPNPLSSGKTDAQGRFLISNVPPGIYQLKVRGVLRNRVRMTQIPVEVNPGPKRTIKLEVSLP